VIDAAKKKQDKEEIRLAYLELGDHLYGIGQNYRAMEVYRMSSCYSGTSEDVINIGIKIGQTAIHNKDYSFGVKFVKDALMKNDENPASLKTTGHLLNSILAILYVGMGKYEKVCSTLWENPVSVEEEINHLARYRDLAFYSTISGIQFYSRQEFKENYYSKAHFKILTEAFPDIEELGKAYINFDFETYF